MAVATNSKFFEGEEQSGNLEIQPKDTLLANNFGRSIFGRFITHFRQISDILLKHSLSKFTTTKRELD